jgi:hypothetical protein
MREIAVPQNLPFIIASSPTLVFVDRQDVSWSVFDCLRTGGRLVVVATGSAAGEFRLFASTEGTPRVYSFTRREARGIEPLTLERQLREAAPFQAGTNLDGYDSTR